MEIAITPPLGEPSPTRHQVLTEQAASPAPRKTRWGCLSIPIIATLLLVALYIFVFYIEPARNRNKSPEDHLRDVFKQSGFKVPSDAMDVTGEKGLADFHGDYGAYLSFRVRPDQVANFLKLDPEYWDKREDFKPAIGNAYYCAGKQLPPGTLMIQQHGPGDIRRRYAASEATGWIYFERDSW